MSNNNTKNNTIEFEEVSLEEFFDANELKRKNELSSAIVTLTDKEEILRNIFFDTLKVEEPELVNEIGNRLADLERLTRNIAHFPSLMERQKFAREERSETTLVESLLTQRGGDRSLHLPSKAILGKGFSVAKFHVFVQMAKTSVEKEFPRHAIEEFQKTAITLMFTIMAEDVYLSLLDNTNIPIDLRQQIASSLIILWEHRVDQNVANMAPILEAVWSARSKLAPVFGTMVGTSELLLLSIEMDEDWCKFISSTLSSPDVSMAMEEFLFGLSYEEVQKLKTILREKGISAIGRDEVNLFLDKQVIEPSKKDKSDSRQFYLDYSIRRDNARARLRMNLPGPHNTLEDHYMRFILEKNKEKQYNDVCAK